MIRKYYRLYIGGDKDTHHSYKDVRTYEEVTIYFWAYAKSVEGKEVVYCFLEGWENNKDLFDLDIPPSIEKRVNEAIKELDTYYEWR